MKKFKFSLEKLLDYRWQIELEAKRNYAACQQEINEHEQQMAQLVNEKQSLLEIREETVNRMQIQQWYLLGLERQMMETQNQLLASQQKLQQALNVYIDAQKERKVLEKLKEKQLNEYQLLLNQEEQKMLDEMGSRKQPQAMFG